ncbi:MAG: hypothetical protein JWM80_5813, partial [Cyanobacteria bacterium RYN_339]|nr:hypothetical protein [Cyanobacteria bacterium RYN_339]
MGGSHRIDRTGGKQPTGPLGKPQKPKVAPPEGHHPHHPAPTHIPHADGHHLLHGDAVRSRDPQR